MGNTCLFTSEFISHFLVMCKDDAQIDKMDKDGEYFVLKSCWCLNSLTRVIEGEGANGKGANRV